MNLYMVRHGQTAASRENRFSGSSDPRLTAVGEAMAQAFAQAYASLKWDAIYTSPMLRARQSADALRRLTGVPAAVEDGLKEIDYGEWEGLLQDEVKER
jgi:probable phosphoglycerate mutase